MKTAGFECLFCTASATSTMNMSRHFEQSLKDVSNLSTIYFYNTNLKVVGTFNNVQNKDKEDPGNFK